MKHGNAVIVFLIIIILSCTIVISDPYQTAYGKTDYAIKNVLILNSYHQSLTWTREETAGIIDTLSKSGYNISIQVEYMDWKRHPSTENLNYLYDYYKYKYLDIKTDIILTTDDAALQFALKNRKELFSDAPIVFCGVNKSGIDTITKDYDRFTGVMEVIDPSETIKTALKINPSLKNIYLLYDNSESGLSTGKLVIDKIKEIQPDLNIISCNTMTYNNIVKQVQHLGNDSIVLITTYYSDIHNNLYEMDFVNRNISENSSVPVYQLFDIGLNNGALGGSMLSGRNQGQTAADQAIKLLRGSEPDQVPIETKVPNHIEFDYNQLEHFSIPLSAMPKDAVILNRPFSFYETYRTMVLSVLAIFIALLLFVFILLFYIRKIKKMKKELSTNHEELTQIYEELTASDEEMRQQYDEILVINEKIRLGEEKLSYHAYHDTLTSLPNKLSLYEASENLFCPENEKIALLFIDIDNFKNVNDAMGHAFGDQLIIQVSDRLKSGLSEQCSLFRLSGDEFVALLQNIQDIDELKQSVIKLMDGFTEEFTIDRSILHISLSIGIALYPDHGNNLEQLLKYADIAMYHVKENGRKNYILYDSFMNDTFIERINIEQQLHHALDNHEFEVYYQPQLDISTDKITGFEALLRWHNPILGTVPPLKFIKVAEEIHFIIPLGLWVLKEACRFLKRLQKQGYLDVTVSVNISVLQLMQVDFFDSVEQILKDWDINPNYIELEITETVLIESFESIWPELKKIREKNIRIALDDFGKGYSSLYYLKQMPISTLKVDKSFVDNITMQSENDLTEYIINIGKSMNMCVVAEGVETFEQLGYLKEHGCDKIQGYLFSKPVPEAEIFKLLNNHK